MPDRIDADLAAAGRPAFRRETVRQGVETSVWAGIVAFADEVAGRYRENCHVSAIVDGPSSPVDEGVRSFALDPVRARTLWAKSEAMMDERF